MSFAGLRIAAVGSDMYANGTQLLVRVTSEHPTVVIAAADVASTASALTIDWGDGTTDTYTKDGNGLVGYLIDEEHCTHDYQTPGDYVVTLSDTIITLQFSMGEFARFEEGAIEWAKRLVKILKWGNRIEDLQLHNAPLDGPFEYCSNLEYVAPRLAGFRHISDECFAECTSLTKLPVIFSPYLMELSCYGMFRASGVTDLSTWLPGFPTLKIGSSPFSEVEGIRLDTIPSTVTAIGDSTFTYSKLTSLSGIPSSVTSFGDSCFYHCNELTTAAIPNTVKSIGASCFAYCSSLTSVTASSLTSIGESAFYSCTALTTIAGLSMSSLTYLGHNCFADCEALSVITPIQYFPGTVLPQGLFSGCSSITDATPVTNNTHITEWACRSLADIGAATITIPSRVTTLSCSTFGTISNDMFESSSNKVLSRIIIQGRTKAQVLDWSKVSSTHRCTPLTYSWYNYDPYEYHSDIPWTKGGAPWGAGPIWAGSGGAYHLERDIYIQCTDGTLSFGNTYPISELYRLHSHNLRSTVSFDCCS